MFTDLMSVLVRVAEIAVEYGALIRVHTLSVWTRGEFLFIACGIESADKTDEHGTGIRSLSIGVDADGNETVKMTGAALSVDTLGVGFVKKARNRRKAGFECLYSYNNARAIEAAADTVRARIEAIKSDPTLDNDYIEPETVSEPVSEPEPVNPHAETVPEIVPETVPETVPGAHRETKRERRDRLNRAA